MILSLLLAVAVAGPTDGPRFPSPADVRVLDAAGDESTDPLARALADGGSPDARDADGRSALVYAVWNERTAALRLLIDAGARLEATDGCGATALIYAVTRGSVEIVRDLLAAGADPNHRLSSGQDVLYFAVDKSSPEIVELLLDHGASQDTEDTGKATALHLAAAALRAPLIPILVAHGADVNATTVQGWTPLAAALSAAKLSGNQHSPAVEATLRALVCAGAEMNVSFPQVGFPINDALREQYFSLAEEMIALGADVNAADGSGDTPLMAAAAEGDRIALEFLLRHGADPAVKDAKGLDADDIAVDHHNSDQYFAALTRTWPAGRRMRGPDGRLLLPCGLPVTRVSAYFHYGAQLVPRLDDVDDRLAAYIEGVVRATVGPEGIGELLADKYSGGPTVRDWLRKRRIDVNPLGPGGGKLPQLALICFRNMRYRGSFVQVVDVTPRAQPPTPLLLGRPGGPAITEIEGDAQAVLDLDCDGRLDVVVVREEPHSRDAEGGEREYTFFTALRVGRELTATSLEPKPRGLLFPELVRPDVFSPWTLVW